MDGVVILTHTRLDHDNRIRRQIRFFSKQHKVIVGSQLGDVDKLPENNGNMVYKHFEMGSKTNLAVKLMNIYLEEDQTKIKELKEFGKKMDIDVNPERIYEIFRYDMYGMYIQIYNYIIQNEIPIKAIICNDVFLLPIGLRFKRVLKKLNPDIKLIGDMHELHFQYLEDMTGYYSHMRLWLVDTFLPYCDLVLSVSDIGVELYKKRYPKKHIIPIRNVPEYEVLEPSINEGVIRLVHVGVMQKLRRPMGMIESFAKLPDQYTLDCYMPLGDLDSIGEQIMIEEYIKEHNLQDRITFHEPVPAEDLIKIINQYDIGIYHIEPTIPNQKYYLPNKLFEYIQARLAVVMTPLISPKEIIEKYDVGKVSIDYTVEEFANTIIKVAENLSYYKNRSNEAAKELNTEEEWRVVEDYIEER